MIWHRHRQRADEDEELEIDVLFDRFERLEGRLQALVCRFETILTAPQAIPASFTLTIPGTAKDPVTMTTPLTLADAGKHATAGPFLDKDGLTVFAADGVTPATAADLGLTISWTSTNPAVCAIDANGTISFATPPVEGAFSLDGAATLADGTTISGHEDCSLSAGAPASFGVQVI